MATRNRTSDSMGKKSGDFHPAMEDVTRNKAPVTAAIPAGLDDLEDPAATLQRLSTGELNARAAQLAIHGHAQMKRDQLIKALTSYRRKLLELERQ